MHVRTTWWAAVLFALFLVVPVPVRASQLYGIVSETTGPSERFYVLNQSTGAATQTGVTTVGMPFDLASDPRPDSPRMWVADWENNTLLTVTPSTGVSTLIGSFETTSKMRSLAFDTTSGILFGITDDRVLYTIDPDTAAPTQRGMTGVNSGFLQAFGSDLSGHLFAVTNSPSTLFRIDPATAHATPVANLSISGVTDLAARPEDGVMFACSNDLQTENLYTVNTSTGTMTLVGPYGGTIFNMLGLAFSPIPEPTLVPSVLVMFAVARARSSRKIPI